MMCGAYTSAAILSTSKCATTTDRIAGCSDWGHAGETPALAWPPRHRMPFPGGPEGDALRAMHKAPGNKIAPSMPILAGRD